MTRVRRALTVAVMAVACGGWTITPWTFAGCSPTAPKVAVVGDSLIYQAEYGFTGQTRTRYFTYKLTTHGWTAAVTGMPGKDTNELRTVAWNNVPDVAVMAFGTNDRRDEAHDGQPQVPTATSQTNVRNYMARFPKAGWVLVGVVETPYRGLDVTGPAWNDWLEAEAARTGAVFVDWDAVTDLHPEYLTWDQTHHTAAGVAGYQQAIIAAVEAVD